MSSEELPPNAPSPPTRTISQRTLLMIGIGAAGIMLLLFAACAGGVLVYTFSGSSAPPDVKVGTTLDIVTTNNNPFWEGKGIVLEVRGHWVRMKGSNDRDPTVWINFNNVVYHRVVNK